MGMAQLMLSILLQYDETKRGIWEAVLDFKKL